MGDAIDDRPALRGDRSAPPPPPLDALDRQRLVARLDRAFGRGPYVEILAGPGWGKSTVAAQYARSSPTPVVWVECGDGDDALDPLLQRWQGGERGEVTVVLDAAESLSAGPGTEGPLHRLVGLRPPGARVLLCTSRHLGGVLRAAGVAACTVLTESDLRITARDAHRLHPVVPVGDLLRDTGGWVAGAALLARGRHDPRATVQLNRLIRSAVIDRLPPAERSFLQRTAILSVVTVSDARALLGEEADALLHSVRRRVLPLVQVTDESIVLRRPLREVLLADLSGSEPALVDELSQRHLEHLQAAGRTVEAVSWCVAAGDRAGALHVVERAVAGLPNGTPPSDQVTDWMQALGPDTLLSSDLVAAAVIRRLHADRRTHEAAALIRRLIADERLEQIIAAHPDLHATVLWCLHERPTDALDLLDEKFGSYRIDAVSYMVSVLGSQQPVEPPLQASWGELAALVHWGMIWQGRLDEVIDSATDSQSAFEDNPNVVIAALWAGRPDLAATARAWIPAERSGRPQAVLAHAASALADGRCDRAIELLEAGRHQAERAGQESTFDVLHAYALLATGRAAQVIPLLTPRLPTIHGGGHRAIAEWARFVLGLAHLEAGDLTAAETYLGDALASMRPAGRLLLASAAERVLAEVRLRAGQPAGAAVAGLAPSPAPSGLTGHVGSRWWEAEVVARTPLVEAALGEARLAGATGPRAPGTATAPGTAVVEAVEGAVLHTFGDPAVLQVGADRYVLRRTKLVELIADLALHGGSMDRDLLLERLLPDVDRRRASNYFRQVVFKVRELIGVSLRREGDDLVWPEDVPLRAIDVEVEQRLDGAGAGTATTEDTRAVFDLLSSPYLPGSELPWVVERRNHLGLLYEKAVVAELNAAFRAGDLEQIRDFGARAVATNPYAEDLYLLMVRAEHRWGSVARGRSLFRAAQESMKDLGIEVSDELREAAQRLGAVGG